MTSRDDAWEAERQRLDRLRAARRPWQETWTVDDDTPRAFVMDDGAPSYVPSLVIDEGDRTNVVAQVEGGGLGDRHRSDRAALIAAAPDLYRALAGLLEELDGDHEWTAAAKAAHVALAKARGER